MPGNLAQEIFTDGGTFIPQGGVTQVTVFAVQPPNGLWNSGFIDPLGNAMAWGINTSGQLGDGTAVFKSSPVAVVGGHKFLKVISNNQQPNLACFYAQDNLGALYAWGANSVGNLGDGTVVAKSSPVPVLGGLLFSQVVMSSGNAGGLVFGITPNPIPGGGNMYAWGQNGNGVLGLGDILARSSPVAVLGGLTFKSVAIGAFQGASSAFGITTSGALFAWGANNHGQLGVGNVADRSSPVAVLGGLTFAKVFPAGTVFTGTDSWCYGLTTAGVLYAWGSNTNGQLGVGDVLPRSSPVAVLGGLTFQNVAADNLGAVVAMDLSGALWAWGFNNGLGGLGVGDAIPRSSPVAVLGGLTFQSHFCIPNANAFAGGGSIFFAQQASGALYAWGSQVPGIAVTPPPPGILGVGDTNPRSSPVAVVGGLTFTQLYQSNSHCVFGVTGSGTVYAWGVNTSGELGVGDTVARSSPVAVLTTRIANSQSDMFQTQITVVPGQSYPISLAGLNALFGSTVVGQFCNELIVQYQQ